MSVKEAFALVPAFKDSRLASLYSDFSHLKDYNPEGYDANCQAWKNLITQCFRVHAFKSSVSIPAASLATALLSPKYGEVKALHLILDQMVKERTLVPWSLFQQSSFTSRSAFTDYLFPSALFLRSWTSLKLSLYTLSSLPHDEYFIDVALLKEKADDVLQKFHDLAQGVYLNKLYNEDGLVGQIKAFDSNLSVVDAKAIIVFLTRHERKIQSLQKEVTYYKLDESSISENDMGIINLKAAIEKVKSQTQSLEDKVDKEIPSRIQTLLANGKSETTRSRVKNLLVQKNRATKSLEQSSNLLEKLTDILEQIDKAETNASMFSTLQAAKKTLTAFNEQISVSNVDEVMLDIDDQISKTNEISDSLNIAQEEFDTSDIDRELEELEAEELKKQETYKEEKKISKGEEEVLERLRGILLNDAPSLGSDTKREKERSRDATYAT